MDNNGFEDYLRSNLFFKGLEPQYIRILAGLATERDFDPAALIFQQDKPADYLFVVLDGQATIEIPALYGPPISIQSLSNGEVLGWSWLIPPYKWHFDARAVTKTKTLAIDGKRLREQCEQDSTLGYELMKRFAALMSERLQEARMQIMEVAAPPEIA